MPHGNKDCTTRSVGLMTEIPEKSPYFVPSDRLKELRELAKTWKNISPLIGGAVQFRIVVDTNIVLGDIRWLVHKRKNESARTSLIETIEAGTIEAYVPPALFDEVEEKIDFIAREDGLDKTLLLSVWGEYQKKLSVTEPDSTVVQSYSGGVDPDDAVFIALAEVIGAIGVVSKDRDIAMMGGKQISLDFVFSLRDYSRATAIELNIKCMGLTLTVTSLAVIRGVFEAVRALIVGITKAPDWVKALLIVGAIFCAVHPGARQKISMWYTRALAGIKEVTPTLISHIADAAAHAEQQRALAKIHLDRALEELDTKDLAT